MSKYGLQGRLYAKTPSYATVDMKLQGGGTQTVEVIASSHGYMTVQVPSEVKGRYYIRHLAESQFENYTRTGGNTICG